jgi:hypothetical protein
MEVSNSEEILSVFEPLIFIVQVSLLPGNNFIPVSRCRDLEFFITPGNFNLLINTEISIVFDKSMIYTNALPWSFSVGVMSILVIRDFVATSAGLEIPLPSIIVRIINTLSAELPNENFTECARFCY